MSADVNSIPLWVYSVPLRTGSERRKGAHSSRPTPAPGAQVVVGAATSGPTPGSFTKASHAPTGSLHARPVASGVGNEATHPVEHHRGAHHEEDPHHRRSPGRGRPAGSRHGRRPGLRRHHDRRRPRPPPRPTPSSPPRSPSPARRSAWPATSTPRWRPSTTGPDPSAPSRGARTGTSTRSGPSWTSTTSPTRLPARPRERMPSRPSRTSTTPGSTDGKVSLDAAYQVGVELEKRDIADLEASIADDLPADVDAVLGRLLAGSRNHLAAYERAVDGDLGTGTAPVAGGATPTPPRTEPHATAPPG